MRQEGRPLERGEGLVGRRGVLVVVGVPLQLEEEVVREAVRRVPAMHDRHLLVLAVRQLPPQQSVVFQIRDGLQVEDGSEGHQAMRRHHLQSPDAVAEAGEGRAGRQAQAGVVGERAFALAPLLVVDCDPGLDECAGHELVERFSFAGCGGVVGRGDPLVVPV